MTYADAKIEFEARLYEWAKQAMRCESEREFRNFDLCSEGVRGTCEFLRHLDAASKAQLEEGLLHRAHESTATRRGESFSFESLPLSIDKCWFKVSPSPKSMGPVSESNIAKARQIKKALRHKFRSEFGESCLPADPLDGKSEMVFRMESFGWIVKTWCEFGRWAPEFHFSHNVWTGSWITAEQPEVLPYNCLAFRRNYGNILGIGTGWGPMRIQDIEPICDSAIEHCRTFFNAMPTLLRGLELNALSES